MYSRLIMNLFLLAAVSLSVLSSLPAQQTPPPPPADTTQAVDTTQSAVDPAAQPDSTGASRQFLLPSSDELETEHGYNLKVTVRMAPVYADSTLISEITGYLPRGSVVGVLTVLENWYRIDYGPEEAHEIGWLISYGVERTHEMEHIVTTRDDANRWEGQRVIVLAGETAIRSFPSSAADILIKAYRNEIFELAGASEEYYLVKLSNAVSGWLWRGDVDIYEEPKYAREQVRQMYVTVSEHKARIDDLGSLISDLERRNILADSNLAMLAVLDRQMQEEAARLVVMQDKRPFFQFDSLKNRLSLQAGVLSQGFASDLGLDVTMMMGLGLRYRPSEKLSFEIARYSGDPALLAQGDGSGSLPVVLSGLDSLTVSGKFWQVGARWMFGGLGGVPLLGGMDNYLYGGLGFLTLQPTTAGFAGSQNLWGPVLGWGFSGGLFSSLSLDAGLRVFLTQTEVTDIRFSGQQLLQTKSVFLANLGFAGGVSWRF
ncbi:MAG: hypothetical protein FVQ81_16995 [Candidatus Glassbacteria bacterium]|nr:hypothetical protein [Candidatus Glassbacteria bacterium]